MWSLSHNFRSPCPPNSSKAVCKSSPFQLYIYSLFFCKWRVTSHFLLLSTLIYRKGGSERTIWFTFVWKTGSEWGQPYKRNSTWDIHFFPLFDVLSSTSFLYFMSLETHVKLYASQSTYFPKNHLLSQWFLHFFDRGSLST